MILRVTVGALKKAKGKSKKAEVKTGYLLKGCRLTFAFYLFTFAFICEWHLPLFANGIANVFDGVADFALGGAKSLL